jgi:hypothetical protein
MITGFLQDFELKNPPETGLEQPPSMFVRLVPNGVQCYASATVSRS